MDVVPGASAMKAGKAGLGGLGLNLVDFREDMDVKVVYLAVLSPGGGRGMEFGSGVSTNGPVGGCR